MENKDLRNMNNEEFLYVFTYLKEKTFNFSEIKPELLIENNQYLLIFRIILNLDRNQFANILVVTKDYLRSIEAKRRTIEKMFIAEKYTMIIQVLFSQVHIDYDQILNRFRQYKIKQDQCYKSDIKELASITYMSESDFFTYFYQLKKDTTDFTIITPSLFMEAPQSLVIFRAILDHSQPSFSNLLCINSRTLRNYEAIRTRMSQSFAQKISDVIKTHLSALEQISYDNSLHNFRKFKNFFGNRNFPSLQKSGLKLAKLVKTDSENHVESILKNINLNYSRNFDLQTQNKVYSVDFVLFDKEHFPIAAIEVFETKQKFKSLHHRVPRIDHRFQAMKRAYPHIKTILIIQFNRPIIKDYVKHQIVQELMNTDFVLINNETDLLQQICTTPCAPFSRLYVSPHRAASVSRLQ